METPLPLEFRVGSKPSKQAAAEWLLQTSEKNINVTDELREEASIVVRLVPSSSKVVGEDSEVTRTNIDWEMCHSRVHPLETLMIVVRILETIITGLILNILPLENVAKLVTQNSVVISTKTTVLL
ncbi:hypothetical protein O0547_05110 [Brevibacillus laterosporus]|uniref:hypothetical protein n=1 Tax=Brevibacillus laterosporus TaxID=1465 RepID=UPI0022A73E6E|nr:hypothetical protein [Brevibacillus laterosporus]MCZ0849032.1 hypothetical protein [Brevibacillus laterosporus]